jgi:hypothetical protein
VLSYVGMFYLLLLIVIIVPLIVAGSGVGVLDNILPMLIK